MKKWLSVFMISLLIVSSMIPVGFANEFNKELTSIRTSRSTMMMSDHQLLHSSYTNISPIDAKRLDEEIVIIGGQGSTAPKESFYVDINISGGGNVITSPSGNIFEEGTVVELMAIPKSGWKHDRFSTFWGDNFSQRMIVTSSQTVTASFTKLMTSPSLTVNVVGGGWVDTYPSTTSLSMGQVVSLTPHPYSGWQFSHFDGDVYANSITMSGSKVVTATFTKVVTTPTYLTINIVGNGSVQKYPNTVTHSMGDVVVLSPSASEGWIFSHYEGDVYGNSITMSSSKVITASFTKLITSPSLTVNVVGGGWVDTYPSTTSLSMGQVVSLTPHPYSGWQFSHFDGDVYANSITMTGSKVVTATFTKVVTTPTYLTINIVGNGSVQKYPNTVTHSMGDVVVLSPSASEGWIFSHYEGDVYGNSITMSSSKVITASFTKLITSPSLTVNVVGGGWVDTYPSTTSLSMGQVVSLTPHPYSGWQFSHFDGDVYANSITMTGSKVVTATFTKIVTTPTYLTINIVGNGSVQKYPNTVTHSMGEVVVLSPSASEGWIFSHYEGDVYGNSITMSSSKVITATFTEVEKVYDVKFLVKGNGSIIVPPHTSTYTQSELVQYYPQPAQGWMLGMINRTLIGNTYTIEVQFIPQYNVKWYEFTVGQ